LPCCWSLPVSIRASTSFLRVKSKIQICAWRRQHSGQMMHNVGLARRSSASDSLFELRELREEAGVQGVICRDIGMCSFPCDTRWFLCEFQGIHEHDEWPERRHRQRRLFSLEEAAKELLWKPWMMLVLHAAVHGLYLSPKNVTSMRAESLWNGSAPPTDHSVAMSLVLHPSKEESLILAIQSTDHCNALPPSAPDLRGTDGLWNYEVAAPCSSAMMTLILFYVEPLLLTFKNRYPRCSSPAATGTSNLKLVPGATFCCSTYTHHRHRLARLGEELVTYAHHPQQCIIPIPVLWSRILQKRRRTSGLAL
jgi:hypothetical protein